MKTIKAVVKTKADKGFEFIDIPKPSIQNETDVLLKVKAVSLCGTDVSINNWTDWASNTIPVGNVTGHEGLYEVVEVGSSVSKVKPGDVVTAETHLWCGDCFSCNNDAAHMCDKSPGIIGVNTHGVWAEYTVLPENIIVKADGIKPVVAGILEPLGNAIHTTQYSEIKDKHVLITGAGPIGVMAILVSKAWGAKSVSIMELNEYRINMAKEAGVDNVIDPSKDDVEKISKEITDGNGFDVVLEMTGAYQALNTSIDIVKKNGEINILSVYKDDSIPVNMNQAVFKNIKLQTLNGRKLFSTWDIAIEWIQSGKLKQEDLERVVTHKMKLEDFEEAFKIIESGQCGKILLDVSYLNEGE